MIHPTLLKAQCVVQRVHSTSPHHMIKSGSDLNPTYLTMAVVLLLVMSFTTQVGPTHTIIISLLIEGGNVTERLTRPWKILNQRLCNSHIHVQCNPSILPLLKGHNT